ncbi:hypothetical protein KP509_38G057700 [Ceratopteris richardii]|uniref:Plant bHLH transcription factor ACT-like domain-containing protein n=1 Tax=Ceratopteris richardii TaxID=49495 RepID=A0A8T2Q551_CERRI|nr:hypothetical protein KP509_38G057700 [Ceratopteris richardii]
MTVSPHLPSYEPSDPSSNTESSASDACATDVETGSSCSSSIFEQPSDSAMHEDAQRAGNRAEAASGTSSTVDTSHNVRVAQTTHSCLRVSKGRCCKGASTPRYTEDSYSALIACLRYHLASLRSALPPVARSSELKNVLADALRYKRALTKELEVLREAMPYAQQVSVKRSASGCLRVKVSCDKEPGLVTALMDALDGFGVMFTSVRVSCQNDMIKIDAVSTEDVGEIIGPLKIFLMSTIMRFSPKNLVVH